MSKKKPYAPACDFEVGEAVWFPVVTKSKTVRYVEGHVHAVHDSCFAVDRGNAVNVVVVRNEMYYPTHSNLLRKTKEPI